MQKIVFRADKIIKIPEAEDFDYINLNIHKKYNNGLLGSIKFKFFKVNFNSGADARTQCNLMTYHDKSWGESCQFIGFLDENFNDDDLKKFISRNSTRETCNFIFYKGEIAGEINENEYDLNYSKNLPNNLYKLNWKKYIEITETTPFNASIHPLERDIEIHEKIISEHNTIDGEYVLINNQPVTIMSLSVTRNLINNLNDIPGYNFYKLMRNIVCLLNNNENIELSVLTNNLLFFSCNKSGETDFSNCDLKTLKNDIISEFNTTKSLYTETIELVNKKRKHEEIEETNTEEREKKRRKVQEEINNLKDKVMTLNKLLRELDNNINIRFNGKLNGDIIKNINQITTEFVNNRKKIVTNNIKELEHKLNPMFVHKLINVIQLTPEQFKKKIFDLLYQFSEEDKQNIYNQIIGILTTKQTGGEKKFYTKYLKYNQKIKILEKKLIIYKSKLTQ